MVQCLQKELKKVRKTKFELDLFKIVDCFLDGHGNYDSNLVSFKKNFINEPFFDNQRGLYKSIGSANDIVNTPIKNAIAIKKEKSRKIVPNVRQTHITHS